MIQCNWCGNNLPPAFPETSALSGRSLSGIFTCGYNGKTPDRLRSQGRAVPSGETGLGYVVRREVRSELADRGQPSGLARGLYPTYGLILLPPLGGAS